MKKLWLLLLSVCFIGTQAIAQDDAVLEVLKQKAIDGAGKGIDKGIEEAIKKSEEKPITSDKSGFLLGLSLSFKEFNAEQIVAGFEKITNATPSLNSGLTIGYQHYFNQYIGIRGSATANVGTKAFIKADTLTPVATATAQKVQKVMQKYIPISAGADIKVLANAYESGSNSFGFSGGLGYEVEWYVVESASADTGTAGALKNIIQAPQDLLSHGIYPEVGVYYYMGNHQFELTYRFAEISFLKDNYKDWNFIGGDGKAVHAKSQFLATSSFIISYFYRF